MSKKVLDEVKKNIEADAAKKAPKAADKKAAKATKEPKAEAPKSSGAPKAESPAARIKREKEEAEAAALANNPMTQDADPISFIPAKVEKTEAYLVDAMTLTAQIKTNLKHTVAGILEIGKDLNTLKQTLPHGQFGPWIQQHFEMSSQSANNFMNAAARFGNDSAMLGFSPTVIYELAAPSTPDSVVDEVKAKAAKGEKVKVDDVQKLKKDLRDAEKAQLEAEQEKGILQSKVDKLTKEQAKLNDQITKLKSAPVKVEEVEKLPDGYTSAEEAVAALEQKKADLEQQIADLAAEANEGDGIKQTREQLKALHQSLVSLFNNQTVLSDPAIQTDAAAKKTAAQIRDTLAQWAIFIKNAESGVQIPLPAADDKSKASVVVHMTPKTDKATETQSAG